MRARVATTGTLACTLERVKHLKIGYLLCVQRHRNIGCCQDNTGKPCDDAMETADALEEALIQQELLANQQAVEASTAVRASRKMRVLLLLTLACVCAQYHAGL